MERPADTLSQLQNDITLFIDSSQGFIEDLANRTKSFVVDEVSQQTMDVLIRSLLLKFHPDLIQMKRLLLILQAVYDHESPVPFLILEEWIEMIPVWRISEAVDMIEEYLAQTPQTLSSSRGKGLVLLRMCNEMLRRIDKSHNSRLSGKILVLLSKSFSSAERSGVNLKGEINVDTVDYLKSYSFQESFAQQFWRMQTIMYHPLDFTTASDYLQQWGKILGDVLVYFEKHRGIKGSSGQEMHEYPKFIPDERLFELQLLDLSLREIFLLQSSIFIKHLQRQLASKGLSKDTQTLQATCGDLLQRIASYLTSLGESEEAFYKLMSFCLEGDANWVTWKSKSCPSYEKAPANIADISPVIPLKDCPQYVPYAFDSEGLILSDRTFREQLSEQLDPESGIEKDYYLSRNEIFAWRFLKDAIITSSLPFLEHLGDSSPESIENLCKYIMVKL